MIVANEDSRTRLKGQDDKPVTSSVGKKTNNWRLGTRRAKVQGGGRWGWTVKLSQAR